MEEKLTKLAKLLGEENEKRLKDEVTDILIEHIREDLENTYAYLIPFDEWLEDIAESVKEDLQKKYEENMRAEVEKKMNDFMKGV